jgi:hypothetical protein
MSDTYHNFTSIYCLVCNPDYHRQYTSCEEGCRDFLVQGGQSETGGGAGDLW